MSAPIRRLLIISYHLPPDGAIGGMRWAGFSKHLARLGWDVHIVTASPMAAENGIEGVHTHVCRQRRTLNDVYNATANRFKRGAAAKAPGAPVASAAGPPNRSGWIHRTSGAFLRSGGALRRSGGAWLTFPDSGRGWILRAAAKARALLRAQPFDLVLSSGPPHSAHIAGLLATLGRREPHWIDMRDPWADTTIAPTSESAAQRLTRRLERMVRNHARLAIVTTSEFAATLRLAERWLPVAYVSNGVDLEQLPAPKPPPSGGCIISYAGTLYGGRNLTTVLAAMRHLVRGRPELRAAIKLHFAGNIDVSHTDALERELAADNIAELVVRHGVTSRARALDLLNESHLALVLAQDQHLMIPAKIYESMALGVPTLVIAEPSSAAAREAKRIGAFTVGVDDIEGIAEVIEDILAGRIAARVAPSVSISHKALAQQLDQLFRERA